MFYSFSLVGTVEQISVPHTLFFLNTTVRDECSFKFMSVYTVKYMDSQQRICPREQTRTMKINSLKRSSMLH
jgi:hypothetical protein